MAKTCLLWLTYSCLGLVTHLSENSRYLALIIPAELVYFY